MKSNFVNVSPFLTRQSLKVDYKHPSKLQFTNNGLLDTAFKTKNISNDKDEYLKEQHNTTSPHVEEKGVQEGPSDYRLGQTCN